MGADKIKYAYSNGTVFFKAVKKVKNNPLGWVPVCNFTF